MLNAYRVILLTIGILILGFSLGYATARTVSAGDADAGYSNSGEIKCFDLPSRYSIRMEYREGLGIWVPYTEDGPAGVNGGLIYLFSSYRTCSQ